MSNGNVAVEVDLNEHIERIDIVQDDSHATTYALVSILLINVCNVSGGVYPSVNGREWRGTPYPSPV